MATPLEELEELVPPRLDSLLVSVNNAPEVFLQPSTSLQASALDAAKAILDPVISHYSVFRELALKGLDVEQIWEQVRLVGDQVKREFASHKLPRDGCNNVNTGARTSDEVESEQGFGDEIVESAVVAKEAKDEEEYEGMETDEQDGVVSLSDEESLEGGTAKHSEEEFPWNPDHTDDSDKNDSVGFDDGEKVFKKDAHGLNDQFFSIDDFNRMTEQQDYARSEDADDDDIDYFADPDGQGSDDEDDQPDDIKYEDFFLPPPYSTSSKKRKREPIEDIEFRSDEEEFNDEARASRFKMDLFNEAATTSDPQSSNLSKYAQRQAAIRAQVEHLEQENIAKKEWMYIGEATAKDRPKNSLLELSEELEVERSAKPVPAVTEERTRSLEEIIKQRIIDDNFDDVVRKLPPSLSLKSQAYEDDPDMQEPGSKPTRGLAEIYEQEHLRRIDPANNPTPLALSVQKQHAEIDELWKSLSHQLDSLTSWRFIPAPEIVERVVTNIPTIDMEDARPDGELSTTMLAPQEVYKPEPKKGEIVVGGLPVARVEMSREQKVKARKRQGKNREKKKLPAPEGSKKDIINTLKKGGVKIISTRNHAAGRVGDSSKG